MEFRILGCTGLQVSLLGIGSWQLSGPLTLEGKADGFPDPGRRNVIDLIQACGDHGINVIDSAELYGDGEGERRIGEAIRGRRDRWILSTKFGMYRGARGERIVDTQPSRIRVSLEMSLERLGTDYVDIYLFHSPPQPGSIPEARDILERLKQEGKIRFYGISTNNPEVLKQLLRHKAVDVVLLSQSLLTHPAGMLKLVEKQNLGIMVRGALGGGRLSGKYFHCSPAFADDDIRKHKLEETDFKHCSVYERFLLPDVPMASFALRYLMDFDSTHTILLGGKTIKDYRVALKAIVLPRLDLQIHQALADLRRELGKKPFAAATVRRLWHALSRGRQPAES